jgi:hypothetical protein
MIKADGHLAVGYEGSELPGVGVVGVEPVTVSDYKQQWYYQDY